MPIPPPPVSESPLSTWRGGAGGRGVCHVPTVLVFIRHVHRPALCGAGCVAADSTACCLCPSPQKKPRCQLCLGSAQGALHGSESSLWPLHQASAGSSCQAPPCGPGRPPPCRAACPPPGRLPGAPAQAASTGVLSCRVSSTEAEGEARSPLIPESPEPGWAPTMHRSLSPGALSNGLDGEHPLCPCHSSPQVPQIRCPRRGSLVPGEEEGLWSGWQHPLKLGGTVTPQDTYPTPSCPLTMQPGCPGRLCKVITMIPLPWERSTASSDPTGPPALPWLSSEGDTFQLALFLPHDVLVVLRGRPQLLGPSWRPSREQPPTPCHTHTLQAARKPGWPRSLEGASSLGSREWAWPGIGDKAEGPPSHTGSDGNQ